MKVRMMCGAVAVLVASMPSLAGADEPVSPKAAFAALKGLVGDWDLKADGAATGRVSYRLTGGGSVVMETLMPGTDHEMVSMYHLDGDTLRMTHYCAGGNQPHLKFDPKASRGDYLVFDFDGGTNLDPAKDGHMHAGRIALKGADRIESEWDGYTGGKKAGTHKFVLSRAEKP